MSDKSLPARPDLQWLRKSAKDQLKLARKSDQSARLADVQLSIAREYGFKSWRQLKKHVDSFVPEVQAFNIGDEAAKQWLALVGSGDVARVREALKAERRLVHVVGPHPFWGGKPQALHVCIERKDNPMFDLLIEFDADPTGNNTQYSQWSPLMLAVNRDNLHARDALLKRGARIGLFEALLLADDERVDAILREDPDVLHKPVPNNGSAIQFARTVHAIDRLAELGASLDQADEWGTTPVQALSALGSRGGLLVKRLAELGTAAGPDAAARMGDLPRLQQIAEHNPQVARDDQVMLAAVDAKQLETVRWLLDRGANVNARMIKQSKQTALHVAAWNGDLDMVKLLVERGADVSARDEQYNADPCAWAHTAIQVANRSACLSVVEYLQSLPKPVTPAAAHPVTLVDRFIDVATAHPDRDHKSGTIQQAKAMLKSNPEIAAADIFAACVMGNHRRVRVLLAADPSLAIKSGGFRNWLPLCYVAFSRFLRLEKKKRSRDFVRCAKLLLDAGADSNSYFLSGKERETALYGACGVANDAPLTKLLLDRGARVTDDFDHESLYHVTEFDDHACLKIVLKHVPRGPWLNYCMNHQMDREDPVALKHFIKHGADVNWIIDRGQPRGWRALHFAIDRRRSARIIQILLDAGADPLLTDVNGVTPLQWARRKGHQAAAKILGKLTPGQPLTQTEQFIQAVMDGKTATAKRLMASKGFVDTLSMHERAFIAHVAAMNNIKAVRVLLDLGFDINAKGEWGGSAIHQAAWCGHVEVAKLLLSRGADLKQRQDFGGDALHTALHGAVNAGHKRGATIVKLIARAMEPASLATYVDDETPATLRRALGMLLKVGGKA